MSRSLTPIKFWTQDIVIARVISATNPQDMGLKNVAIRELGQTRLAHSALFQFDGENCLLLQMQDNEFIEFTEVA